MWYLFFLYLSVLKRFLVLSVHNSLIKNCQLITGPENYD